MPAERVVMRVVREVLRLTFAGISKREVARRTGLASSTVRATIARFQSLGLTWPLPETVTDSELEAKLYKNAGKKQGHRRSAEPDWAILHREMKRKHVTLSILWDEYIEAHPEGYRYSRFCELYRSWEGKISVTMRQTHLGGDKLFVDYAGDTAPVVIDRLTGEIRKAQIFVAVLGASNFTYAEATWTQSLADWIGAHTRAFEAIGGVTRLTGQHQDCGHQGVPVRAASQSDLYGDGSALRHWRAARKAAQATRQGQSRSRRADHGTLDSGPSAQSAIP
jgi:transposase